MLFVANIGFIGIILEMLLSIILFFVTGFVGNIILFDSVLVSIIGGIICNKMFHVHPAICLIIAIVLLILLIWIQHTTIGFWILSVLCSLFWSFTFGFIAYIFLNEDMVWFYVVMGLGFIFAMALHFKVKTT